MKESMDVFGKAMHAHQHGKLGDFSIINSFGDEYSHGLKRYFRSENRLTRLEKKLISLCKGDILDVGCATGYYIPLMMKKGKVTGIDISKHAIKVARENKLSNCLNKNIFSFRLGKKYDTITMLENNIGMGSTIARTRKLLVKLSSLLKPKGSILAISTKVKDDEWISAELYPVWNGKIGPGFVWLSFNIDFLSELCKQKGLRLTIIDQDRYRHLVKIEHLRI